MQAFTLFIMTGVPGMIFIGLFFFMIMPGMIFTFFLSMFCMIMVSVGIMVIIIFPRPVTTAEK